jgi:hypothetical protein
MGKIFIEDHVSATIFEDSTILLDLRKNVYYTLNETASEFWKALTNNGSIESALREVSKLYRVSPDTLKKDMNDFIASLVQREIIKI